jgi:hypothetical protein
METSDVRRRVVDVIERAKRGAAERRTRADEASREYAEFLERVATPLFRQVANVLKIQGYPFTVFTPSGSVRLMSDKRAEDFIELALDTSGEQPALVGHSSRARGRRVIESEQPIGSSPIRNIGEEQLLSFLLTELGPFVER